MAKKTEKNKVTHEDIQQALEKFKASFGLIKILPEEYAPSRQMAADQGIFENVGEVVSTLEQTD